MGDERSNGVVLGAIDFLNLTEELRVSKVDLSPAGKHGFVYVRELSSGDKRRLTSGVGSRGVRKARVHKDKSMDITIPDTAEVEFLKLALVTDETGKTLMIEAWLKELGTPSAVNKRLERMPNAITNLIVKRVREISGLDEEKDELNEKKAN